MPTSTATTHTHKNVWTCCSPTRVRFSYHSRHPEVTYLLGIRLRQPHCCARLGRASRSWSPATATFPWAQQAPLWVAAAERLHQPEIAALDRRHFGVVQSRLGVLSPLTRQTQPCQERIEPFAHSCDARITQDDGSHLVHRQRFVALLRRWERECGVVAGSPARNQQQRDVTRLRPVTARQPAPRSRHRIAPAVVPLGDKLPPRLPR